MIKVTIEATEDDKELLDLFRDHLCYGITDDSGIILKCPEWDGHSGGDDAYFGLMEKMVRVEIKK